MGPSALMPLLSKACCGFLLPLKSIASAGFEPDNLGSNNKHANHYTTEATIVVTTYRKSIVVANKGI
jgi:hypothetical protein